MISMDTREENPIRTEKQIESLDKIIHDLEATANVYYHSDQKMWSVLLRCRDNLKPIIEKEKMRLHKGEIIFNLDSREHSREQGTD